jgi:hypothetical protein
VSPEHLARIESELEMLRRLLSDHAPLLEELQHRPPTPWERSACGALLHAFYNGVENIFKNVAQSRDEAIPRTGDWHASLLERMSLAHEKTGMIDGPLAERLKEYLRFRHFFRHAYVFDIRWEKMSPLLDDLETLRATFESQIRQSLA